MNHHVYCKNSKIDYILVPQWLNFLQEMEVFGPTLVDGRQQPVEIVWLQSLVPSKLKQIFNFQHWYIHLKTPHILIHHLHSDRMIDHSLHNSTVAVQNHPPSLNFASKLLG